jgi:hypothetical protein
MDGLQIQFLTLVGDKTILLVPGIDRNDCTYMLRLVLKGIPN